MLLGLVHLYVGILQRQGIDPNAIAQQAMGVSLSSVFDGPEAQFQAYEQGYVAGWQQFQASMMQIPELVARIQWVPVTVQPPPVEQPAAPVVVGNVMGPGFVPAAERARPAPVAPAAQPPKAKNMTKPMDAEEIAALAGSPVDVPTPPPSDARNGTS